MEPWLETMLKLVRKLLENLDTNHQMCHLKTTEIVKT